MRVSCPVCHNDVATFDDGDIQEHIVNGKLCTGVRATLGGQRIGVKHEQERPDSVGGDAGDENPAPRNRQPRVRRPVGDKAEERRIPPDTKTPEQLRIESLRPALSELERALNWAIGGVHSRLVPVIQTKGKKTKCLAWFLANTWSTREGEEVHEVSFCAEDLKREVPEIIATVIHEAVHVKCQAGGLKDTSKGGRHNKVFKEEAEQMGLVCAKPFDSYGFGYTEATPELRNRIEKEFKPDYASFNLFRLLPPTKLRKPSSTRTYRCDCSTVKSQVEIAAHCDKCEKEFIEQ